MRERSRRKGGGMIMGVGVQERVEAEKKRRWREGRAGEVVSGREEG
jgi:hypothetical protein